MLVATGDDCTGRSEGAGDKGGDWTGAGRRIGDAGAEGERWRRAGEDREIETAFPFEDYEELLLNWAISYMLNQNRFTTPLMQRIEYGDEAAVKFRRLYDMIKNNYSYLVFQSLKDLKATLSSATTARLDIPELDIELTTTLQLDIKIPVHRRLVLLKFSNRKPIGPTALP